MDLPTTSTGDRRPTLFGDLASTSARLASTRSRLAKQRALVEQLAKLPEQEVAAAVAWLVAEPLCGPLGVGPAQLWQLANKYRAAAADVPTVSLAEVEQVLGQARAQGRDELVGNVERLFQRLTESERVLFVGALTGSLRQGSLGGVMQLALAELSGHTETEVRRAVMVKGSIAGAAEALLGPHRQRVPPSSLVLFRALAPMLASSSPSLEEALGRVAEPLVEWKVDGLRAQVHKQGDRVAVYSRQGNDITEGLTPLLSAIRAIAADSTVLDGEVLVVDSSGAPRPFQDSFSAIASKGTLGEGDQLKILLFDCLHRDGVDLVDEPLAARLRALHAIAPCALHMPGVAHADSEQARRFYGETLASGHEGVMVKDLTSPYRLGARGRVWQKVKEFASVELVVLAAEWGSGRRRGFLSNLHLGARRDDGSFCMVGKTFKGLTDEMLRWQTVRLQELAIDSGEDSGHVVFVEPALVTEIRFNEVQRSPRYPGGIALRFARVVRYREDKSPSEIEPLSALIARLGAAPARDDNTHRAVKTRAKRGRSADPSQLSLFDNGEKTR